MSKERTPDQPEAVKISYLLNWQAVKKQACISLLSLAFYQAYALLYHIS